MKCATKTTLLLSVLLMLVTSLVATAEQPPRVAVLPTTVAPSKQAVIYADRLVSRTFDEQIQLMRIGGRMNQFEKESGSKLPRHLRDRVKREYQKQIPELKAQLRESYLKIYTEEELKILDMFGERYLTILNKYDTVNYRALIFSSTACQEIMVRLGREQEWNR